jgi:uncharacterized membrane protein
MRSFKPLYGVFVVLLFLGAVLVAELVSERAAGRGDYERVRPEQGVVRVGIEGLKTQKVKFFRFLNSGNQEVRFFVGRDAAGHVQVAFDADETCAKSNRGFRSQGEWVVCNKCDKSFRLADVNAGGGGCKPVPLPFRQEGEQLLIAEADVLQGWRLFH